MNTQTILEYENNDFQEDFHDDFDSTYYVYGNRTDTFKLNHKCKN